MAVSVVMSALEMAQETRKLLAWLKKKGDAVRKGEALTEIENDKATFELEAPARARRLLPPLSRAERSHSAISVCTESMRSARRHKSPFSRWAESPIGWSPSTARVFSPC